MTRLDTVKGSLFKNIPHLRDWKGEGSYGTVFQAVDQTSGHTFAIKVVELEKYDDADAARALLHREIKVVKRLNRVGIAYPNSYPPVPGGADDTPRHISSNI